MCSATSRMDTPWPHPCSLPDQLAELRVESDRLLQLCTNNPDKYASRIEWEVDHLAAEQRNGMDRVIRKIEPISDLSPLFAALAFTLASPAKQALSWVTLSGCSRISSTSSCPEARLIPGIKIGPAAGELIPTNSLPASFTWTMPTLATVVCRSFQVATSANPSALSSRAVASKLILPMLINQRSFRCLCVLAR